MFSSVPWISMVTLPSHSFLTQRVQLCGMAGTIAKTDTLDPAIEGDVLANHALHEHSHVIPIRQIDEKGSGQIVK